MGSAQPSCPLCVPRHLHSPGRSPEIDNDILLNLPTRQVPHTSSRSARRTELKLGHLVRRHDERVQRRDGRAEAGGETDEVPCVNIEGLDILGDVTGSDEGGVSSSAGAQGSRRRYKGWTNRWREQPRKT